MKKKVLVVGSGGREHTIVWKLVQSSRVEKVFAAPGNGGTSLIAQNVSIDADDIPALKEFAIKNNIDITVVGPEVPLVAGIVDEFEAAGLKAFGPVKGAALLEGSKIFSKEIMKEYGVPTADFGAFTDYGKALEYLKEKSFPIVIKADGLCAGKGVIIAKDYGEAADAVRAMLVEKEFGASGERILIEDMLNGEEVSVLALVDGENYKLLPSSQDHKRIGEGDTGLNTGGMGAYSPAPVFTDDIRLKAQARVIEPVIKAMKDKGCPYKGVLYCGLMVTEKGPEVLEFNVRFGDPEVQAVLPKLKTDFLDCIEAVMDGKLDTLDMEWDDRTCVSVVLASGGYPQKYEKGKIIKGLNAVSQGIVFHAGTKRTDDGIVTSGGRVLNVVALGNTISDAIEKVYKAVDNISFDKMYYRKDIAFRALKRIGSKK